MEHYKIIFDADADNNESKSIDELSNIREIENYLKTNFSLCLKERNTLISKIKSFTRDVKEDEDNKRDAESTEEIEEKESSLETRIKQIALESRLAKLKSQFER